MGGGQASFTWKQGGMKGNGEKFTKKVGAKKSIKKNCSRPSMRNCRENEGLKICILKGIE